MMKTSDILKELLDSLGIVGYEKIFDCILLRLKELK